MLRATRRYAGLPVRRGRWIQGVVPPQVFFPAPVATGVGTTAPLAVATTASTAVLAVATSGATVGLLDGAFPGATTFTGTTTFPGVGFATPIAH